MNRLLKALSDILPNQLKRKKKFYREMEQTLSEKLQDELEPIRMPCPMHEDYDEEEDNHTWMLIRFLIQMFVVQGSCFVIKKRNSKHHIASFLWDNIYNP